MADTLVFRAAVDLVAEAVISHGTRRYVLLPMEPILKEMVRTRLVDACEELQESEVHKDEYVAISMFKCADWEAVSGHPACIHVCFNPMVRWPWNGPPHNDNPMVLVRRARREGCSVEIAGAGNPVYFGLDVVARASRKSTAFHFFMKDVAQRTVVSKGCLRMSGAIIVIRVDRT